MKFVKIVDQGITKVKLDLEGWHLLEDRLNSTNTACAIEGAINFNFSTINEFLARLDALKSRAIAITLIEMRKSIALYGHDDPAADRCVGDLRRLMQDLFNHASVYFTSGIFEELHSYSKELITGNDKAIGFYSTIDREMFVTASLLSALCCLVIHDFETHFTDVDDPRQVLYPVFEEAIRDCGVDDAKKFVEKCRDTVKNYTSDAASRVIEGIYINDCSLRKYDSLPIDIYVVENYTQRMLSSKMYISNKRIREMKEINKAEEQQRMKNNEMSVTPSTDKEIKEFNKKIEHCKLTPVRKILKDTLDVIHFTVKYYLKHSVPGIKNAEKDSTHELLIKSWEIIVANVKSQVDKMDGDEIARIAKHANYVQDAFDLVSMYMPVGMCQCSSQPIVDRELPGASSVLGARKLRGYLRKVLDIYNILNTPAEEYNGASIGYLSQTHLKEIMSGISGAKGTSYFTSDFCGHEIYNTELRHLHDVFLNEQPDIFLKWADENVKNVDKDEFLKFLTKHKSEITAYIRLKQSYPNLTANEKDEVCAFFCRWFLKEQAY